MNHKRKSYPLRVRPEIISEMKDIAKSNDISLNKQIERVLESYLIRRKLNVETEVSGVSNLVTVSYLIDEGKVAGCGHCGNIFEEDDFAFAKETGGCPYCRKTLTQIKFKED